MGATKRMVCAPTLVTHARACGLHLGADRPHTHLEMFCLCGFIQEGEVGAEFLSPRPEWGGGCGLGPSHVQAGIF